MASSTESNDPATSQLIDYVTKQAGLLNGRYEGQKLLNSGSFGAVFLAWDTKTSQTVALKAVLKPDAEIGEDSAIKVDERSEEREIHELLGNHPHIVSLTDAFETEKYKFMTLEYCAQGDLHELIRQGTSPRETEHVRKFMFQLLHAVDFCHISGVAHRDIKPENIFMTESGSMKLGDFGLATRQLWSYENSVGSDHYMAPEQYDHQGAGLSTPKADIWSIGVCLLNILFGQNVFEQPTSADPRFRDFVNNRESLFDLFPDMSLDTFHVLEHCLHVNPGKRSLNLTREALERVVSFTLADESLDEFCTDPRDVVTSAATREPLRTPSITSPPPEQTGAFAWPKLQPQPTRQLSVIQDTASEDLFPGSEASARDWCSNSKTDSISVKSIVDSGLGVSVGSNAMDLPKSPNSQARPIAIAESLPTQGSRTLSSFFGKKKTLESKSWSDLQDEEEEEMAEHQRELERARQARPMRPFAVTRQPTAIQFDSESEGRSTPRATFAQLKQPDEETPRRSSVASQDSDDHGISENTGFMFEEDLSNTPTRRYSPPPKRNFFAEKIDKWSALGDRRRGAQASAAKETSRPSAETAGVTRRSTFRPSTWKYNLSSYAGNGNSPKRPVTRAGGDDAQEQPEHKVFQNKNWNMSTDWRRQERVGPEAPWKAKALSSPLDGIADDEQVIEAEKKDTTEKWVGGWRNPLRL